MVLTWSTKGKDKTSSLVSYKHGVTKAGILMMLLRLATICLTPAAHAT